MAAHYSNKIDLLGFKVGNLEVIAESPNRPWGTQVFWVVKCHHCNTTFEAASSKIKHRQIGGCKKCGKHPNFRGFQDITGNFWRKVQDGAKSRNFEFSITIEQVWGLYIKQNRKCKLSGLPIFFNQYRKDQGKQTASIDRIDSSIGYTLENIQLVHKDVNKLKGKFSDAKLIELCKLIAEYRKDE